MHHNMGETEPTLTKPSATKPSPRRYERGYNFYRIKRMLTALVRTLSIALAAAALIGGGTTTVRADDCSLEKKTELAYAAIELWLSGNTIDPTSILAPDYTNHLDSALGQDTETQVRNVDAFIQEIEKFHAAFTDVKALSKIQVADGDMVATRVQLSAVHSGSLFGEKPTGKTITYDSAEFTRIEDCKVAETWTTWDKYAMFYQIGLIPGE